jgi:adenylosuccinate lyase
MTLTALTALSPLDGRYASKLNPLREIFSEYGLIKARVEIEIRWLQALAAEKNIVEVPEFSKSCQAFLNQIIENFDETAAKHIKELEHTTNHDVKAVEYYLKEQFSSHLELSKFSEFIHFACTSEDINNLAYGLMIIQGLQVMNATMSSLIAKMKSFATQYANIPMLSRTHGQPASPTTLGKEFANFVARCERQLHLLQHQSILGKINGAVGNFNAHIVAYPEVDWLSLSEAFVTNLGMTWNSHTTQIEPHDGLSELLHTLSRFNTILIDFNRDMWGYIALGVFDQELKENEVGSSTMPHKINPIDFENSEGNLGIANALAEHLAHKLPISRWQRDLSDSTVLRNLGIVFGYSLLAYQSTFKGLGKLVVNTTVLENELDSHWEVLTEALQTVMRRYGVSEPYEKAKRLSRGKVLDQAALQGFIQSLEIPAAAKDRLLKMAPGDYIGLAALLAQNITS